MLTRKKKKGNSVSLVGTEGRSELCDLSSRSNQVQEYIKSTSSMCDASTSCNRAFEVQKKKKPSLENIEKITQLKAELKSKRVRKSNPVGVPGTSSSASYAPTVKKAFFIDLFTEGRRKYHHATSSSFRNKPVHTPRTIPTSTPTTTRFESLRKIEERKRNKFQSTSCIIKKKQKE